MEANLSDIIEKIKDIISKDIRDRAVYDKDVANTLHILQPTFATMKKRNSIPYKELMEFCVKKRININWLFFNQPVESIEEETKKYEYSIIKDKKIKQFIQRSS